MKKNWKITITLALFAIFCSFTALASAKTVLDNLGRSVEIPNSIQTIVALGNTPRMLTYLGLADKIIGIGPCEITKSPIQAYAYINKSLWEKLPQVGTDAMGETAYYPEEIIKVAPDVVLCSYSKDIADSIQKQTGIPVIAVNQGTLFQEDYNEALRVLAEVCGAKDRAEEVISYINKSLNDLKNRTKDIAKDAKPSVLAAAATFKGTHGIEGIYSNYPVFSILEANDLAKGVSDLIGGLLVDKEKIIVWNPDILFLDSEGVQLVKIDYEKNPNYYKQLKSVQNAQVYQYSNSTYHWTNVEIPIVIGYFVGALLYPEQFKDIQFEAKANEIFKFFLNTDNYLEELNKVGAGFQKVELGAK